MRRIAAALLLSFIVAPMALATALRPGPSLFDMALNPLFGSIVAVFDLNPSTTGSGPSLLTDAVTMNGQTMTLLASCDARNAGATWTCTGLSSAMTRTGTALTSTQTAPFSETGARELVGNTASYYTSAVGDAEVGSSDFVIEFVRRRNTAAGNPALIGRNSGAFTNGWEIYSNTNGTIVFQTYFGAYRSATVDTIVPSLGQWSYYLVGYDSSAAQAMYVVNNGAVATTSLAGTGDLTNASGKVAMLARPDGTIPSPDSLAFVRIWKCTDCLDSTSFQTEARRRFARAAGVFPSSTADPTMTFARASTGYIDNYDGSAHVLNLVGQGWPRVASRLDTGATKRTGYLAEPQSTNIALQSEAIDTALNWTATNTTVGANALASPITTTTAESLESPDALGAVEHYARQAVTLTAATYAFGAYVKAGTATHAWLRDATIVNGAAWINLSTCAVATTQAGIIASYGQKMSGGWCRFGVTFTGTAVAHNLDVGYSNADNVTAYDDGTNATIDAYAWGAQAEQQDIPTSYVLTTTASATRLVDALQFAAPTNGGTLETQLVTDAHVATVSPFSFATTAQGALAPFCNTATTDWRVNDLTNGASITSGVACITGVPTTIRQTITTATGSILYRDGTSIGTDATVSFGPLTGGTTITAGATRGLLLRGRVWSQPYTPTEAP